MGETLAPNVAPVLAHPRDLPSLRPRVSWSTKHRNLPLTLNWVRPTPMVLTC